MEADMAVKNAPTNRDQAHIQDRAFQKEPQSQNGFREKAQRTKGLKEKENMAEASQPFLLYLFI